MASSLPNAPLRAAVRSNNSLISHLYPSVAASCQCRQFSLSSQRRALRGTPENISMKQPAQPSMRTRGRELARADLPQDIGLLPGTFIRPLWRDMPSIFQQPSERLRMEWLWLKSGVQNFLGMVVYSKWLNTGLPLRLRERRYVARDLHKLMYSAFAERINNRLKDEKVTWSLEKYNRTPGTFLTGLRVVSDRATQIPEIPDSGVRQVVVRITSRQSTGKIKLQPKHRPQGPSVPAENAASTKQQDCTEYIVVQKLRWAGEEEDWRIWGHATPTTVEDLSNAFFAPGMTVADRLEAMKDSMQGRK
ncbi:hypothetical protein EYZ11_002456 [Aspergillus tanneri]|uniref:Tim44-like domain-containing protein n=1 Tax=Aspergillus tanneri TaxID=1220188 RepID=A0A4S3JRE5_9EURO|nr:hypothetical protein EYZ11_002456 [Aspergillus tanneri]